VGGGEEGRWGDDVVSKDVLGYLKQFLNTVHRSVYCKCACVLQLG
jgi:hypothetical protein